MGLPNCRMVHTQIWESEQFLKQSVPTRLLFIGMITIADDSGRLKGDAHYLKRMFFYRDRVSTASVEKMIQGLEESGLIIRYFVEDTAYIVHPHWRKYQKLRLDRTRISHIPAPPPDIESQFTDMGLAVTFPREENSSQNNKEERVWKISEQEIGDMFSSSSPLTPAEAMKKGLQEHTNKQHKHPK
jgi:hypothetical protein